MSGEVGGAGGASSYEALKRLDKLWSGICTSEKSRLLDLYFYCHYVDILHSLEI